MTTMLEDFKKTYKEKSYLAGHEFKNDTGLPLGCPHHYGYEKERVLETCCILHCQGCWEREMENND